MRKKVGEKQHLFKGGGRMEWEKIWKFSEKTKHEVIIYSQVQVDNLPGLPMTQHKNQTFSEAKIKYSLEGTPFALVFLNLQVFHSIICNYRRLWVDKWVLGTELGPVQE